MGSIVVSETSLWLKLFIPAVANNYWEKLRTLYAIECNAWFDCDLNGNSLTLNISYFNYYYLLSTVTVLHSKAVNHIMYVIFLNNFATGINNFNHKLVSLTTIESTYIISKRAYQLATFPRQYSNKCTSMSMLWLLLTWKFS